MDWLSGTPNRDGYVYKDALASKFVTNEAEAKSMVLRFLIHFAGDIHQPLHCVVRVNEQDPKGDMGGNTLKMKYRYGVKNFHALWDSAMYKYRKRLYLPLTDDRWAEVGEIVNELTDKITINANDLAQ